jgi:hypothetical protein
MFDHLRLASASKVQDHPAVAVSLDNLAELYRAQGRVAIRERDWGEGDSIVSVNQVSLLRTNFRRFIFSPVNPMFLIIKS